MSEPGSGQREWHCYVRDMVEFSEKVLSYTEGIDFEDFITDSLVYDATLRNLELIGEAATHVPAEVREAHGTISWKEVIGIRNRLAHAYLFLDDDIIWDVIKTEIPELLCKLRSLLTS